MSVQYIYTQREGGRENQSSNYHTESACNWVFVKGNYYTYMSYVCVRVFVYINKI